MKKILTAKDIAKSLGYGDINASEWYLTYAHRLFQQKLIRFDCSGGIVRKYSVFARIDTGRWIADCPICSRSNYVAPEEPVFYCFGCGNQGSGSFVPVIFPDEKTRKKIESLLLERPVIFDESDENPLSQTLNSRPAISGFPRNWNSDQSLGDLKKANERMKEHG